MVNPNPPLFVQDGEYPAKLDRSLIGGLTQPGGDANSPLLPRGGVRAHYVDDSGLETSLRVERSGTQVKIMPGSAFVRGPMEDGIASLYFITNPVDAFVNLPTYIANADQQGMVGIKITDPGDAPVGEAVEGKWEFVYLSIVPTSEPVPAEFLRLANITIPGNATDPAVVVDSRDFTTANAGTFRIATFDTLRSALRGYPYGSQAYSMAEDITYVRSRTGWAQHPALTQINSSTSTNDGIYGRPGELLWNTVKSTLAIQSGGVWTDIARKSSAVRMATATSWPEGPNEAQIVSANLRLNLTQANIWVSLSHSTVLPWNPDQGEVKPSENNFMLQVYNYAPNQLSVVYFYATVAAFIKNASGGFDPDTTNTFFLNVEAFSSVAGDPMVFDENGRPDGFIQQYSMVDADGEQWTTVIEKKDAYNPMGKLDQGIINFRPVFKAAKPGFFEIRDFKMRVTTT